MYGLGCSLIPSAYYSFQLIKEKTGFLKGTQEIEGDFHQEFSNKIKSCLENRRVQVTTVKAIINKNIAHIGLNADVVRYKDNYQVNISSLFSMDEKMLDFVLQHEISHIANEDTVYYQKASLINSLVCGLGLGCLLPGYVAAPLTCCLSYTYGTSMHHKRELRADLEAIQFCDKSQIRGGLRLFKLNTAIYRVSEIVMKQDKDCDNLEKIYENLQKATDEKMESYSSTHPLNSVRIELLEDHLKRKGFNPKLSEYEICNMSLIGREFFKATCLKEKKEGDKNLSDIDEIVLDQLAQMLAYSLKSAELST